MITLVTGPAKRRFSAHKDVLCTVPFFQSCLEASFLDAHTSSIELPDDDADAVGAMVSFLYSGEYFPRIQRTQDMRTLEALPHGQHHQRRIHVHVHTLAEKYAITGLRDLAFRKIFLIDPGALDFLDFLRQVYTITPPTSKLRYANRMEEYWVLGLHERLRGMRVLYPEELGHLLGEYPEFTRDLVWSLSSAVDCVLGTTADGAGTGNKWS